MLPKTIQRYFLGVCLFLVLAPTAHALEQITRPYQSVRSAGMGGVRITTGLYDENFFSNPARVTANPWSRYTFLQLTPMDFTTPTVSVASSLMNGTTPTTALTSTTGTNLHERFQLIFPAYYHAAKEDRKLAFGFAIITSVQVDSSLRQAYQLSSTAIADTGIHFTIGRKFLNEDQLSIGLTTRFVYRISIKPEYSLSNYVSGTTFSLSSMSGDGAMVDGDFGATYKIMEIGKFDLNVGAAIQNILGGTYTNIPLQLLSAKTAPVPQPRSLGVGVNFLRHEWGQWKKTVFALEFTDILNNGSGSIFRLIHIGAESHWRFVVIRLGMNQGYYTAGLGIDTKVFNLDLATYGEEMGLNAGSLEDRRYALTFGLHI